jgi:hypothetical protein
VYIQGPINIESVTEKSVKAASDESLGWCVSVLFMVQVVALLRSIETTRQLKSRIFK